MMPPHPLENPSRIPLRLLEGTFWRMKFRLGYNMLRRIKRHYYVHIAAGLVTVIGLLIVLLVGFSVMFHWLLQPGQQPFGAPMLKRLMGMVLLAFFSMLTFSNLIIMLTTTYISREVEFLMAQPISHRRLFFCKFGESTLYSSWAFLILALPFFVALGGMAGMMKYAEGVTSTPMLNGGWTLWSIIPDAPWYFFPVILSLIVPYVLIPATLGAMLAMTITAYFPAKKMIRLAVVLALLGVGLAVGGGKIAAMRMHVPPGRQGEIGRVMGIMGMGDMGWVPSTWLSRGVRAALMGDWQEIIFWWAMLTSTALMGLQACQWLSGPLYYRGFCNSRNSGTSQRKRSGGIFLFFDTIFQALPSRLRALIVKDFTVFWRDPAQWGQLMVLFGLLSLYFTSLGGASGLTRYNIDLTVFKILIPLFNVGATCFILAILSTRFIYPMLSLEGKQQWVIGLAPIPRTRLVWAKFGMCWLSSLAIAGPLILYSCAALRTDAFITILSVVTIAIMSLGVNALATGLGALMPNFQEDNPARIANGLGGTINLIASMFYVGMTIALLFPIVAAHVGTGPPKEGLERIIYMATFPTLAVVQGLFIFIPMHLGLKNWRKLEF